MEKDLESQVETLLGRLLTEHLVSPAGKQALTRWFIDRLQTERRGWKGRLRDASKATDSEHRLALASQAIIQRVNQQMKERLLPHVDDAADSDDVDDDVDKRMARLQVIERNWETASCYIDKLERDRTDCLQVLGVPSSNSDVDVVAELRGRLEAAGLVATSSSMMTSSATQQDDAIAAAVAAETAKHESTIAELKKTNESLQAKFKTLYKASQDAKQRHSKDVAKLQKTVSALQKRAREQQAAEVEKTGGQTTAEGDVSGEVGATSADSRSGVVLPPVNVASPQSRVSLTNPQATSAGDHHQNPAVRLSATQAPASPVSMPPLALPRNSPTTTPRANPPTTAIVLPSLASDTSAYQNINDQPPNSLRSQVLGFASRLADARREVADCQRALIRLQQATVAPTPSTHRSHRKIDSDDNPSPRRRQRFQLAAKSVTTIRLQAAEQLTPRSRASESTYRLMKEDDTTSIAAVAAAAAGISSYNMFARQQKTPRRYWRC